MPEPDQEPCPDEMVPASPGLLTFDYATAEREGWTIAQFDPHSDGTPVVVIMCLDVPGGPKGGFRNDQEARQHVAERAAQGSALHLQAMSLVDRNERFVATLLHG